MSPRRQTINTNRCTPAHPPHDYPDSDHVAACHIGMSAAPASRTMSDMIDAATDVETAPRFLRRSAVIVVALLTFTGLAVTLTSRNDTETARDLCTTAASTQFATPVKIISADRMHDDTFLVRGTTGTRTFTCLVTREPVSDHWELASVS
jgi:hypothetical protein